MSRQLVRRESYADVTPNRQCYYWHKGNKTRIRKIDDRTLEFIPEDESQAFFIFNTDSADYYEEIVEG